MREPHAGDDLHERPEIENDVAAGPEGLSVAWWKGRDAPAVSVGKFALVENRVGASAQFDAVGDAIDLLDTGGEGARLDVKRGSLARLDVGDRFHRKLGALRRVDCVSRVRKLLRTKPSPLVLPIARHDDLGRSMFGVGVGVHRPGRRGDGGDTRRSFYDACTEPYRNARNSCSNEQRAFIRCLQGRELTCDTLPSLVNDACVTERRALDACGPRSFAVCNSWVVECASFAKDSGIHIDPAVAQRTCLMTRPIDPGPRCAREREDSFNRGDD